MTKLGKKSSQQPFTVCTQIFVGNSAQTVSTNMHFTDVHKNAKVARCKMQECVHKKKQKNGKLNSSFLTSKYNSMRWK